MMVVMAVTMVGYVCGCVVVAAQLEYDYATSLFCVLERVAAADADVTAALCGAPVTEYVSL